MKVDLTKHEVGEAFEHHGDIKLHLVLDNPRVDKDLKTQIKTLKYDKEDLTFMKADRKLTSSDMHTNWHTEDITGLATDGKTLISVSKDRTARFWDLTNEGDLKLPARGRKTLVVIKETLEITGVAIAPGSRKFCLGGGNAYTGGDPFLHIFSMTADRRDVSPLAR